MSHHFTCHVLSLITDLGITGMRANVYTLSLHDDSYQYRTHVLAAIVICCLPSVCDGCVYCDKKTKVTIAWFSHKSSVKS